MKKGMKMTGLNVVRTVSWGDSMICIPYHCSMPKKLSFGTILSRCSFALVKVSEVVVTDFYLKIKGESL